MKNSGKIIAGYSSTWPGVMDFLPAPGPTGESGKRPPWLPKAHPQAQLLTGAQHTHPSLRDAPWQRETVTTVGDLAMHP